MTSRLGCGLLSLLLLPAFAAAQAASDIDRFFTEFTDTWMGADPDLATRSRYFSGDSQDRLERQITPKSVAWKRERIDRARDGLARLRAFDRTVLTAVERVSADLMDWQLQTLVDQEPFLDFVFPLEQFEGANVRLVWALTVFHPLATARDAENYVATLRQVDTRMNEAVADARALADRGVLPPRFILEATIGQLGKFIEGGASKNPFVTVLAEKMRAISGMTEAERQSLNARAEEIVTAEVEPTWRRAIALLESQLSAASADAGLWRLPGGDAAYRYFLRLYTTTSMTPNEIHTLGLERVAALEHEMDGVLRTLGRNEGSVKERIAKLSKDLSYPDPSGEASRETIMRDIEKILADALVRAPSLFDKRPKSAVTAAPYARFEEANQAARSMPPSPDGTRPGVFMFPRRVDQMTRFRLRSLTYHEAVPGHFFQVGHEVENTAVPRFRQLRALGFISAFGEGWALYAEKLAAESGWYDGDPEGLLGQLESELFRARRLVVDTGLHTKKWTRQQAIDYGIAPSEVERYVVNPGQACSYLIGQLKILELRARVKAALGERFSLKQFHNLVLDTGTVPLDLLTREVERHIRDAGGSVH